MKRRERSCRPESSLLLADTSAQPDHAGALYNLGWLEQTDGRAGSARDYYIRSLKVAPAFWQAHQNLGNLLVLEGRFGEAETQYEEVIRLRPDYAPAYMSLASLQIRRASAAAAQQFPMLDQVTNKVVQKYQTSSCEQLWQEKAHKKSESPAEQKLVQLLHTDPAMRQEFFNRVSMPIVMKMFECGMIP